MRGFAITVGLVLILIGILGCIPQVTPNHLLFNAVKINWAVNFLYLLSGLIGVVVGLFTYLGTRLYFEILGIVYAIWAILGFVYQQLPIFGIIANNMGTTWLNVVIAVTALILGFGSTYKTVK